MKKKAKISTKSSQNFFKYWFPVITWAAVIFIFSSFPTRRTTEVYWQDFLVKKAAHIIEYAVLTILLYRGFINSGFDKKRAGAYSIILAILYAGTDEYHQSFTPGREPRVRDTIFDTIGASLAIYSLWNLLPKAPERLKNWAKKLQIS